MAMQSRERMLALGLGMAVGLILLYWGFGQYRSVFNIREAQVRTLTSDVAKDETKVALIDKAIAQRRELEDRSLPTNPLFAESEYSHWLFTLVDGKLTEPNITFRTRPGKPEGYQPLGFEVKGEGTLEQITKLLYEFYAANHLQQITSLDIKPQAKGNTLDLTMHVEALIIPSADREDTLSTEKGDSLAFDNYDAYQKAITERNLFAEYTPPVAKPATGTPLDLAKLAFVTNIGHGLDKRSFAWITEQNLGKTTYLYEGDAFEVGGVKGKVNRIDLDNRAVELEVEGKAVTVLQNKSLGDTLAELRK